MTKIGPGWEHYDYEVAMLHYTFSCLGNLTNQMNEAIKEDNAERRDQLQAMWNVYYESWAVHATNLYNTVPNDIRDKYDMYKQYKAGEIVEQIKDQVLTLTEEGRTSDINEKVTNTKIIALTEWLYDNIEKKDDENEVEEASDGEG